VDQERQARLVEYLKKNVVKDARQPIGPQTPLVSSGLVDSMSLIQVLAFVEDEFHVVIPDEAATAESMNSVQQILELIRAYGDGR
jgi:acyl carrier protein